MDAAVQERTTNDVALAKAREAFLEDPTSLTIYTAAAGQRMPRGRVYGKLDERLKAAIDAYLRHS